MHSNPGGPAHPAYKHGRYSRLRLPDTLAAKLKQSCEDEDLIDFKADLMLLQARISERLESLPAVTGEISDLREDMRKVASAGDAAGALEFVKAATDRLDKFAAAESAWAEIVKLLDQKRKLADAQSKIELRAGEVIRVTEAMVNQDNLFRAINQALSRLLEGGGETEILVSEVWWEIQRNFERLMGYIPDDSE